MFNTSGAAMPAVTSTPSPIATSAAVDAEPSPAAATSSPVRALMATFVAFQVTALAWVSHWIPKAASTVSTVSTASAPVVANAGSGLAAFENDVEASYTAVRTNRSTWLFIALVLAATFVGGFSGGHLIATRGVSALESKITALDKIKTSQTAALDKAKDDLTAAARELKAARATIELLTPKPPAEAAAPALPSKPVKSGKTGKVKAVKAVKAGWP